MKSVWFLMQLLALMFIYAASIITVALDIMDKDYLPAILFMLIIFWIDRQIERLLDAQ